MTGERTLTVCIHGRVYSSLAEVNDPCLDCAELETLRFLEDFCRNYWNYNRSDPRPDCPTQVSSALDVAEDIRARKGPGAIGACTCPGRQGNPGRLAVDSSCPQHGCRTL